MVAAPSCRAALAKSITDAGMVGETMTEESELRREEILEIARQIDRYVVRNELSKALYACETLRLLIATEQLDQEREQIRKEREHCENF